MFRLSFSGGHICWSPYTVATRLLASAGPVVGTVKSNKIPLQPESNICSLKNQVKRFVLNLATGVTSLH